MQSQRERKETIERRVLQYIDNIEEKFKPLYQSIEKGDFKKFQEELAKLKETLAGRFSLDIDLGKENSIFWLIHAVVWHSRFDMLLYLIEHKVNVNFCAQKGERALGLLLKKENRTKNDCEMAILLIDNGAVCEGEDKEILRARMHMERTAFSSDKQEMVKYAKGVLGDQKETDLSVITVSRVNSLIRESKGSVEIFRENITKNLSEIKAINLKVEEFGRGLFERPLITQVDFNSEHSYLKDYEALVSEGFNKGSEECGNRRDAYFRDRGLWGGDVIIKNAKAFMNAANSCESKGDYKTFFDRADDIIKYFYTLRLYHEYSPYFKYDIIYKNLVSLHVMHSRFIFNREDQMLGMKKREENQRRIAELAGHFYYNDAVALMYHPTTLKKENQWLFECVWALLKVWLPAHSLLECLKKQYWLPSYEMTSDAVTKMIVLAEAIPVVKEGQSLSSTHIESLAHIAETLKELIPQQWRRFSENPSLSESQYEALFDEFILMLNCQKKCVERLPAYYRNSRPFLKDIFDLMYWFGVSMKDKNAESIPLHCVLMMKEVEKFEEKGFLPCMFKKYPKVFYALARYHEDKNEFDRAFYYYTCLMATSQEKAAKARLKWISENHEISSVRYQARMNLEIFGVSNEGTETHSTDRVELKPIEAVKFKSNGKKEDFDDDGVFFSPFNDDPGDSKKGSDPKKDSASKKDPDSKKDSVLKKDSRVPDVSCASQNIPHDKTSDSTNVLVEPKTVVASNTNKPVAVTTSSQFKTTVSSKPKEVELPVIASATVRVGGSG